MRLRAAAGESLGAPEDGVVQEHAADDQQDQRNVEPADVADGARARVRWLRRRRCRRGPWRSVNFWRDAFVALAAGASRFAGLMVERGSLDGRMLCTPWQLEQLATTTEPPCEASP